MLYDVRHAIGLFGVSLPLFDPQIVNVLQLVFHIIWMLYVYCWTVGIIIHDYLMLVLGPLNDIVIIIAILVQCLFLLYVCTNSCSPDAILGVLIHLSYNVIGIFTHSCDYDVHISVGIELGPEFSTYPN